MAVKPSSSGAFVKGVDASTGVLLQPKGSVPRASNLVLTKRGSLDTCDGSAILAAYNCTPTLGRGEILDIFFYSPTGVPGYYLMLQKALDQPLGAPANLATSDGGAGGTLPTSVTLFYKVTACDGIGGETTASNEASFVQGGTAHKVILTWNIVPNAVYYNVYRASTTGLEVLVVSPTIVFQPSVGSLTVTITDDGSWRAISQILSSETSALILGNTQYTYQDASSTVHHLLPGCQVTVSGVSPSGYNQSGPVLSVPTASSFVLQIAGSHLLAPGTGGTIIGAAPSVADTTVQLALIKVPVIASSGSACYSNANIVALFPINPGAAFAIGTIPGGSGSGGGGTGGGGGGGGGSTLVISPNSFSFTPGDTQQLTAILNGSTDVTSACTWTTVNGAVATVDNTGLCTGQGPGATFIHAVYNGVTAYSHVTVRSV